MSKETNYLYNNFGTNLNNQRNPFNLNTPINTTLQTQQQITPKNSNNLITNILFDNNKCESKNPFNFNLPVISKLFTQLHKVIHKLLQLWHSKMRRR